MTTQAIIETVRYRTNEGVSDAQYIKTSQGLDTFIARCGGMISRNLYKAEDGIWHEQTVWESKEAHGKAMSGFMASPEGQAVIALIDKESLFMGSDEAAYVRIGAPEMA